MWSWFSFKGRRRDRAPKPFARLVLSDDPMSALQEEARASVGSCAGRVSLAVDQVVALVAVAGGPDRCCWPRQQTGDRRQGRVCRGGAHGGQLGQIKRSARSQEGAPSGPVPSGSTRCPVAAVRVEVAHIGLGMTGLHRRPRQLTDTAISLVADCGPRSTGRNRRKCGRSERPSSCLQWVGCWSTHLSNV